MKRNKEMQKIYKGCLQDLDDILGEHNAGLLIAILLKLVRSMQKENKLKMRTLKLEINNYFNAKWDFQKGDFTDE